ncbi:7902_t:CDS:2 [Funneliformis geosporum]|nr:7902_t:CDS:2 [Funneliformis geosporum]
MNDKSQKIKEAVAKIDIGKIVNYSKEHFKSKTLRQIIRYNKRVQDSNDKQEIFKLATRLAYNFDMIVNKTDNSYQGVRIGCIDIDEKDNQGLKTSAGYFQDQKILDFKISGGIMGLGSIHPNGKPYSLKGVGSFFLQNNKVFDSPQEQKIAHQGEATENLFIPKTEPPMNYKGLERNNFSKIGYGEHGRQFKVYHGANEKQP